MPPFESSPFEPQVHSTPSQNISREQIEMRAYTKWLERGCPEGTSESDWFEALQELEQEQGLEARGRASGWYEALQDLQDLEQDEPTLVRRRA